MKFLSIYLLALALNVSANGFSQTVTLNEKAITYTELFKLIHKQTGYQVFYKSDVLSSQEKINVTAVNASIDRVLKEVLKNKQVQYSVLNKSIVIKPVPERLLAFENARYLSIPESAFETVTGTVTDAEGNPLADVSVSVEGTTKGTTTKADGSFSIDVKPGERLSFSRVGYETVTVKPDFGKALNIKMEREEIAGEEVIVVGYGTQKRANITGAVSSISAKRLENRPITNLATGLQGVSPGLIVTRTNGEPGREGISIQIRGVTSANGNVQPLVVIDGISTSIDALTRINPNDVENITVLKDAASAAIYGSQSSGGVILVTTKSASKGKTQLNASVLYSLKKPINMGTRMSLLDEALYNNLAFFNRNGGNMFSQYSEAILDSIRKGVPYFRNPDNPAQRTLVYLNQVPAEDIVLQNLAPSQTYDISLSGGTEKLNFFASGSLLNEQGMFKIGKDEARRYNGRLKLNSKLTKHISLDAGIGYTNKFYNSPELRLSGDYGTIYRITRLRTRNPLYTPNGNYKDGTIASLAEGGFNNEGESRFDINGALSVNNLVKGLTLKAVIGAQYRVDNDRYFKRTVQLYDTDTNLVDFPASLYNNPNSYSEISETIKRSNVQYLAQYNTLLAAKHSISALAGYEFQDYEYRGFGAFSSNLTNNDIPGLIHSEQVNRTNEQSYGAFAFQSVFGKLNYTFDRRYVLEGTFRRDQSSKLAPDRQAQNFGAVSGAWNVHNEGWFSRMGANVISELKLRTSWGRLGGALGDDYPSFSWANTLNRGSGLLLGTTNNPYYFQGSIPSELITWENIEMTNFGVDVSLFKNKLTVTGEYFVKRNLNMATTVPAPAVLGVRPPKKNIGELKVWGWETEIAYRNRIGKDWNVNVGFNISDNQNELVKFENNASISDGRVRLLEGHPLNTFWGYKTNGYYKDDADASKGVPLKGARAIGAGDIKYVDINGDGVISAGDGTLENHGDLVYLGTDAPRLSFGLNLGVEYRNFDFTLFLQGVGKRNFTPAYHYLAALTESWRQPLQIHNDYWSPNNQDALFPRPYYQDNYNYESSDKWVFNAGYMRVKNIQIGYTLPERITKKFACERMRLFFTGQDILTFTKMKGFEDVYDPESREGVINDYPFFATTSFGLNVSF